MSFPAPPDPAPGSDLRYLKALAERVELRQFNAPSAESKLSGEALARDLGLLGVRSYYARGASPADELPHVTGLQLHALQAFVDNFMNPAAANPRLLLCWDTGTGKTIAAITIAQRFATLFRSYNLISPETRPTVFIIGFTRSVIQAEMLRDPRHGFITYNELSELRRLKEQAREALPGSPAVRQYYGYVGTLKRALTDRQRGGYYRFFGYKEFASQLLTVTARGEREGVKVLDLFLRPVGSEEDDEAEGAAAQADEVDRGQMAVFARRIATYERKGLLRVNNELLAQMRRGLIIADEIHNVYNIHDPNMYGVAIQFALDAFPAEETPRAIFMTATPMSGSPAEIVDLLNLLVPRTHLPNQRPLGKRDFFRSAKRSEMDSTGTLALLPGAVDRISALAAGRVSFLTVEMERSTATPEQSGGSAENAFPERVFVGTVVNEAAGAGAKTAESATQIPFLRFVVCPLTPAQKAALRNWAEERAERRAELTAARGESGAGAPAPPGGRSGNHAGFVLPPASEYSLYDMVFPNPESDDLPLYKSPASAPIYSVLARADPAWLRKNQVEVLSETAASGRNAPVISGGFLNLGRSGAGANLRSFSGKYSQFVEDVIGIIEKGRPGKMLAYHDRVQLTGVAFLAEVLHHNGFVDMGEQPTPTTRCAVCGVPLKGHSAGRKGGEKHEYTPARYAVVAGTMDKSAQERALGLFNRPTNRDGHEVRVLLGSMVIVEGLDFKAVRFQFLLSIPRNIPMLIQILGRSHRRGAHASLPPAERKVETRIYLNGANDSGTESGGAPPPDLIKLTRNMWNFRPILMILSALRRPGINGFLSQSQIVASKKPSLEGLPFSLPLTSEEASKLPSVDDTYYAYGASVSDLMRLKDGVRALFARRPVWEKKELILALTTPGVILGLAGDPAETPADQVELALSYLTRPIPETWAESRASGASLAAANIQISVGDSQEFRRLTAIPVPDSPETTYYVALPVTSASRVRLGAPHPARVLADVESYLRPHAGRRSVRRVDLRAYANRHLKETNFEKRLSGFREKYSDFETKKPGSAQPGRKDLRQILVEYGPDFHYPLLELIIGQLCPSGGKKARRLDPALEGAYKLYSRFKVLVTAGQLRRAQGFENLAARVAGREPGAPVGYLHEDAARIYAPRARGAETSDSGDWHSVPLSVIGRGAYRPENSLVVGYMEVRGGAPRFKIREPRQVLEKKKVRDVRSLARGAVCETRKRADQITLARKLTQRPRGELGNLSTPEICVLIRDQLLAEEEKARAGREGAERGARWFYLFNERLPVLTALLE